MFTKIKKISKKDNLAIEKNWQGYLDSKPETRELVSLFYCNDKEKLNELAWQEIKKRDDLKKENLLDVIVFCWGPEGVRREAWGLLKEKTLEKEDRERIVGKLGPNHPISKEIESTYGKNKEYFLSALKEML